MDGDNEERRVIWVPIVHSAQDLGRFRETVRAKHIQEHGREHWENHLQAIDSIWVAIRDRIEGLGIRFDRVRLYQDGLPLCGKEEAIVQDLADAGSTNHELLRDLMNRGASLEGTESPELLREEYDLAMKTLGDPTTQLSEAEVEQFQRQSRELLEKRDQFIADRITRSLQPGEIALVFLGALHSLDGRLPAEIRLERLNALTEDQPLVPRP